MYVVHHIVHRLAARQTLMTQSSTDSARAAVWAGSVACQCGMGCVTPAGFQSLGLIPDCEGHSHL